MTGSSAVDRVADVLIAANYRQLKTPLNIAGLEFDTAAAFVGARPSPDLIVVADTAFENEQRIQRMVEGIARAMDVVGSKRPLTAVLAGPRPRGTTLDAMSRVCRVLPIGPPVQGDADEALRNWLAVLMPLRLPEQTVGADGSAEMASRLGDLPPEIAALVDWAPQGVSVVQSRLQLLIAQPLADLIA